MTHHELETLASIHLDLPLWSDTPVSLPKSPLKENPGYLDDFETIVEDTIDIFELLENTRLN
ncbi:MAG: hypothetical protein AAF641_05080 [Pseudomonadota bacterium]